MVVILMFKTFVKNLDTIYHGIHISQVSIEHWLSFVDKEGTYFENFLFHASHICERRVVDDVGTVVIFD